MVGENEERPHQTCRVKRKKETAKERAAEKSKKSWKEQKTTKSELLARLGKM